MSLQPTAPLPPLACNYLLVIHVPVIVDAQGRRWIERLWAVDLARHTDYIRHLTVACPFERATEAPEDAVPADEHGFAFVKIAYRQRSLLALFDAPLAAWQLWRLVGRSDFVHSLYGQWWPLDTPYLTNLIARLRGKCLMVNVEASPWRIAHGERASPLRRWQARAVEALNRWTISLADIAFFTHEGYLRDLMPRHAERGHVVHASWIDEAIVQSDAAAQARWQQRARDAAPLRLVFAGRLQEDKGIHVLLDALHRLRSEGRTRVQVSIIGAGDLEGVCREQAAMSDERVQLDVLEPVAYGEPFFTLLRRFDAVLVPSLADEQPRIVYDAYSQALPVLASATPGLKTCVTDGVNGRLFAPADAKALAQTIASAADEPAALQALGLAALATARAMTHQDMHCRRHALIARLLAERGLA